MQSKVVENSINKLLNWIDKNGWKGYDPYDIKGIKPVIWITSLGNKNILFAIVRELLFELFYTFPIFFRKVFRVKPKINAKAMGLFAKSYIDLFHLTKDAHLKLKAEECLNWLIENKIEINNGYGWGYPFHWQSMKFIPADTPNGIVTTAVGDAFWTFFKVTREKKYLEYCIKIATFLASLPADTIEENICFSYTPLYINHVHNLNLFVAEFLIKVGKETGNHKWMGLGNKAATYTISNQMKNGAFDYNGYPEKPKNIFDNYHTGYVLRMLHSIWLLTNRQDVFNSLEKCYIHYISSFFENNGIPKFTPDRKYRIDIHSCAESINCLMELSTTFAEGNELIFKILTWTINKLQHKSGYFYYGILKSRFTGLPFVSKIPYIRWGQAWMLKAMTNYLKHENDLTFD